MSAGVRASRRGFSLIELMVVIIIVGIVSALAIPSMLAARTDRHAYDDAGQIMQLFREARTRAVARGGAVMIAFTAGAGDVGTFSMYEAVTATTANGAAAGPPVASCKTAVWTNATAVPANVPNLVFVDGLNLNGQVEAQYGIQTQVSVYALSGNTNPAGGFICFTPLGRTYFNAAQPVFTGAASLPLVDPIEFRVTRAAGGTIRSVLLPPNGMARVFSHV